MGEKDKETGPAIQGGFGPIDIKAPEFFWLVQPWKEGMLVTIDGWGRFAEISFIGADKMKIKPLVDFPRASMDRDLLTWPEAGLIAGYSGKMHHLAAIDDGKTKSHVPLLSWVHQERPPLLLDSKEGLVVYSYSLDRNSNDVNNSLFIYNYKEDRMIYESRDELPYLPIIAMNERYTLSYYSVFDGKNVNNRKVFYNCRTNEVVENDLSKTIDQSPRALTLSPYRNIHVAKRVLFMTLGSRVKLTWDENYSNVKITPISYLYPEGKGLRAFIISVDGTWITSLVSGYKGLYNEALCKRAFLHLDERYPNGISIPVITEDYEPSQWDYSAFVNHPVHGMCCAQEWRKNEGGKDQLYLRLYRMDAILEEINRRILEETSGIIN